MNEQARVDRAAIEEKLRAEAAVMDVHGETIGTVTGYDPAAGTFTVSTAEQPTGLCLPLSAIGDVGASGLYLTTAKDDLAAGALGDAAMSTPAAAEETSTVGEGAAGLLDTTAATTTTTNASDMNTMDMNAADVSTEEVRVPVREEELVVGKQQEELGRVHLHKDVVEEQETLTAPVTREEVRIERVPVQGQDLGTDADAFEEQDIDVPVMGEELVTGKRAVVKEEVRLQKDAITQNQQVSDTVRKERVTVDGADVDEVDTDVQTSGMRASDMDTTTIDNTTTNINRS